MLINYLKKVIKSNLYPKFDNVPVKNIKLWKVEIHNNNIGKLSNLSLYDNDKLLPTQKVKEYWHKIPEKEQIHIIKLEYDFIKILATTCWLFPDKGELYPQQVIFASICCLCPDMGKYTLSKVLLKEYFL
ncbi:hypothetical protein C2G38_2182257 [Gigaspora rosea]|uniref:Crinkler effector protein N-terminal domain-containing protein n=1 Tax=Gigaspora rosea TaxID=44941 RepID=A0A397VJD7_9GLOM|nr:hypothetical protein C2G38_2182257 [Gigaspora rosea]